MKFKKISTKLILWFSLFILLPISIVGVYSYNTSKNALKQEAEQTLKAILDGTSKEIYMEMNLAEQMGELINSLSVMEEVVDGLKKGNIPYTTSAVAGKSISSFKESIEAFTEDIFIINSKGRVIVDGSNGVNNGLDLSDRDYFKETMEGNKVWGEATASKISGKPISVYSTPLKDQQDQVVGAIAVVFKIEAIQEILRTVHTGQTGYAYMIDGQGRFLYHKSEEMILQEDIFDIANEELAVHAQKMIEGKEDTGFYTHEGIYKLVMYKPVGNWSVAVNIPVEEYMVGAVRIRNNTFWVALVILIIGIVAAFGISLQITNPIKRLMDSIKVVEKGDLTKQVPNKNLQKCWEVMKCDKKECPAYENEENLRCWQIAGTHCKGEVQGEMASKLATCEECPTYKRASGDEIRQMTMSFNNMVAGFQNMIRDVIHVAEQTSASSEELASASEQGGQAANEVATTIESITSNAENQKGYIYRTKEVVNILMERLNEVSQSSKTMEDFSGQVTVSAGEGKEFLEQSIQQIEVINISAQDTTKILQVLEGSINEINKITEVISNISEQTNLLALNANIEAARAGEHGKGFAVVADEVRKLAEETKKSAGNIAGLITHIQQDTDKVIVAMKKNNEEIKQGKENILNTGSSFEKILELIQQVGEQIQGVSRSIKEMQANGEDVTKSVEEIDSMINEAATGAEQVSASAQEQSATAEEIAASSEDLARMAEDLFHYVEVFKV